MDVSQRPRPLWRKLAWFVLLWLGGVGTVAAVAYSIRAVLL